MRSIDLSKQTTYLQNLYENSKNSLFKQSENASADLNKSSIQLSWSEGQLVSFLVKSHGCHRFVEIGTLTGFSALWILKGMESFSEITFNTFEKDPKHAMAAKKIFDQHPRSASIQLHLGDAEVELSKIENQGPFDGIFIDGNKSAYNSYLNWAEKHLKKGALILADNVFLGGAVYDESVQTKFSHKNIQAMQDFNRRLADPQKYVSALLPTSEGLFAAVKLF